jgi:hypothetical protein
MKTVLPIPPTFTPGAAGAGTLNFSSVYGFELQRLTAVLNLTRNTLIYAPGASGLGYTAWGSSILTLATDTATHNSGDLLECIYNDLYPMPGSGAPNVHRLACASTTNATSIVSRPATLLYAEFRGIVHVTANIAFLKIYDKASAPTVGTDVPKFVFGTYDSLTSQPPMMNLPTRFSNGIAIATTNSGVDSSTAAIVGNSYQSTIIYS